MHVYAAFTFYTLRLPDIIHILEVPLQALHSSVNSDSRIPWPTMQIK